MLFSCHRVGIIWVAHGWQMGKAVETKFSVFTAVFCNYMETHTVWNGGCCVSVVISLTFKIGFSW